MNKPMLATAAGVAGLITVPASAGVDAMTGVRLTTVSLVGLVSVPALGDVLHDNGLPNGVNGYSNGTVNAFGTRRTLLDDFTVPAGETWTITAFHWRSVWGTPGGGTFGTGVELFFRSDASGTPGPIITGLANLTAYSEVDTGNVLFSREEHAHWAHFDAITLTSGTYWWEAVTVGPENNFWLTADQQGNECWANYDDFSSMMSGTDKFGVASDLNFVLTGIPAPGALALLVAAGLARTRHR